MARPAHSLSTLHLSRLPGPAQDSLPTDDQSWLGGTLTRWVSILNFGVSTILSIQASPSAPQKIVSSSHELGALSNDQKRAPTVTR